MNNVVYHCTLHFSPLKCVTMSACNLFVYDSMFEPKFLDPNALFVHCSCLV